MKKILVVLGILLAGTLYAQVTRNITITVAAGLAPDVVDAYAFVYSYSASVENPNYCSQEDFDAGSCTPLDTNEWIDNPESKSAFALRKFGEQAQDNIRAVYVVWKTQQGADAANAQAEIDKLGITVN